MNRYFWRLVHAAAILILAIGAAPTAHAEPGFAITAPVPTLEELSAQIHLLVATQAPDAVKAAQLEGGTRALIVPKMIYRLGVFRAPRGSSTVTGPETHEETRHTAVINGTRQGAPTVLVTAEWRYIDEQWKLANKSLCNGISTMGLPIPCNFE